MRANTSLFVHYLTFFDIVNILMKIRQRSTYHKNGIKFLTLRWVVNALSHGIRESKQYANSSGYTPINDSPIPNFPTQTLQISSSGHLSLDGVLALREVDVALGGLLKDTGGVLLGQTATDGTGLLGAEVEGKVLLVLVEQAKLGALVGVDDGQDLGDRLADVVAVEGTMSVMPCHLQAPSLAIWVSLETGGSLMGL